MYVPRTREDLGIPSDAKEIDWDEYFGDTPIYTLYTLVRQQLLAFEAYLRAYPYNTSGSCPPVLMHGLVWNVSGQKHYPKWTNHFDRTSGLFPRAHTQ